VTDVGVTENTTGRNVGRSCPDCDRFAFVDEYDELVVPGAASRFLGFADATKFVTTLSTASAMSDSSGGLASTIETAVCKAWSDLIDGIRKCKRSQTAFAASSACNRIAFA
jgi:hypothetical protein